LKVLAAVYLKTQNNYISTITSLISDICIMSSVMPRGHNDLFLHLFRLNTLTKLLRQQAGDITPEAKQTQYIK
jgi:hypothetical protein